jgi:hypothetical protein
LTFRNYDWDGNTSFAGECQKVFMATLIATYPCETVNKITTVQELVDHLGDYRTKEAELIP